jgi:hypothetical protein
MAGKLKAYVEALDGAARTVSEVCIVFGPVRTD